MSTFLESLTYDHAMSGSITFGEWLLDELDRRELKQREFAEMLGVAPQTVSQWVTNTNPPTRRSCMLIARGLNVPLTEVEERAGAPITAVSKTLGHANPSITLSTYSHTIRSLEDQVADRIDDLFREDDERRVSEG